MNVRVEDLLVEHRAHVSSDNPFQRRARLMQALWRDEQRLRIGEHNGRPLGSRLEMPSAKDDLSNYLTDTIRAVVRSEVLDPVRSAGKLYGQPRIFNDLLSSQPLCFNLFGELQRDLDLASRALRRLTGGRIERVTDIQFEHSPGRGDVRYTGDRSAFDVFVEYATAAGARGFAGIEVKYHEDLDDRPSETRERHEALADAMRVFDSAARGELKKKPLHQIWRDHLLAGSLLLDRERGYADGFFAFLYPKDNENCIRAIESYRACLTTQTSFVSWTLEALVQALREESGGTWIDAFDERYLAFGKIDALLAAG